MIYELTTEKVKVETHVYAPRLTITLTPQEAAFVAMLLAGRNSYQNIGFEELGSRLYNPCDDFAGRHCTKAEYHEHPMRARERQTANFLNVSGYKRETLPQSSR